MSPLGPTEAGGWARQGRRGVPGPLSRDSHHAAPTLRPSGGGGWAGSHRGSQAGAATSRSSGLCMMMMTEIVFVGAQSSGSTLSSLLPVQTSPSLLSGDSRPSSWPLIWRVSGPGCPAPLQGSDLLMGPPTPVLWACLALDPSSVLCQRRMSGLQFTNNLCRPCVIHCLNNTRGTDCPFMVTGRD